MVSIRELEHLEQEICNWKLELYEAGHMRLEVSKCETEVCEQ